MIKAGIVGLGWWGKTLVELAENSDAITFVAGTTRTMTPEIEAFAKQKGLHLTRNYDALIGHAGSTRWCWRRRIRCTPRR